MIATTSDPAYNRDYVSPYSHELEKAAICCLLNSLRKCLGSSFTRQCFFDLHMMYDLCLMLFWAEMPHSLAKMTTPFDDKPRQEMCLRQTDVTFYARRLGSKSPRPATFTVI